MEKKDYKPKYLRNSIIVLLIIAVVASFSYFVIIRKVNYNLGESYYLARLYEDAIIKLKPLGNYQDSRSLYIRSLYRQGEIYYESTNYMMALEKFEELKDILPETDLLITDTKYMMAVLEGVNQRYDESERLLNELDGYAKCNELIEAAKSTSVEPFITENRNHVIAMDFKSVIELYLNSK
ncbi:MAG: hypothetical protein JXQ23_04180 [Clostridia bacterium]|nr:hypothetical protein [Clostridia bacterium]